MGGKKVQGVYSPFGPHVKLPPRRIVFGRMFPVGSTHAQIDRRAEKHSLYWYPPCVTSSSGRHLGRTTPLVTEGGLQVHDINNCLSSVVLL